MLLETLHNRLVLSGEFVCRTALRVGSGKSTAPVGTDLPVIKDAQDRPFIPGSSLKGVLRSRVESYVRAVNPGRKAACVPVGPDSGWCLPRLPAKPHDAEARDRKVYEETCLVCRLFGSPWLASRVQIKDAALVEPDLWFGQYQVRDGVAINRDTQTVAGRHKFDFEVVPAQTRFEFHLVAENVTPDQIGMLFAGLRPFERGEIGIGGGRSRGLGVVELRWRVRKLFEVNDNVDRVFGFLAGDEDAQVWTPITDEDIRGRYFQAFRRALSEVPRDGGEASA